MKKDWKELLTLAELELKYPLVNDRFHPINYEKINYSKANFFHKTAELNNADIVIVKRTGFNFRFCFKNQYKKSSPQLNARIAEVVFDNPIKTLYKNWNPPRFVVLPGYGIKTHITIEDVSWDPDYKKRFGDFHYRKRLQEKLRSILVKRHNNQQMHLLD